VSLTAARHTGGARRRPADILEDAPRILQKQLAGRTQLHAARHPIKKLEADFFLQILNLTGKRRLRHPQSTRRTPVMLVLADCHEISQVPQFHFDTLALSVR
jgi:hypothetical protein